MFPGSGALISVRGAVSVRDDRVLADGEDLGCAVSSISPSKILHHPGTTASFTSFSSRSTHFLGPGSLSPLSPFLPCSRC